eukprot:gene56585-77541_t
MRQSVLPFREQPAYIVPGNNVPTCFDPHYGQGVSVAPDVQRVTVRNPSPFTFHGTNSYIVGNRSVCVIDPGPEDNAHFESLMTAVDEREV